MRDDLIIADCRDFNCQLVNVSGLNFPFFRRKTTIRCYLIKNTRGKLALNRSLLEGLNFCSGIERKGGHTEPNLLSLVHFNDSSWILKDGLEPWRRDQKNGGEPDKNYCLELWRLSASKKAQLSELTQQKTSQVGIFGGL
jgi:hypothetical protein